MNLDPASGNRIYFRELGDGPTIILLHGFTGSGKAWNETALEKLAEAFRVLVVDLPGHGRSDKPHQPSAYVSDVVANQLVDLIERHCASPAYLMGYSMGGRLAIQVALKANHIFAGLILESSSPGIAESSVRVTRRESDAKLADLLDSEGIEPFVERWMAADIFRSQLRLPPEVLDAEYERRCSNDPKALAACLRALGQGTHPETWTRLHELSAPVLLITGELDGKYGLIANEMLGKLTHAEHRVVADAGHAIHLEKPTSWAEEIVNFLGSIK